MAIQIESVEVMNFRSIENCKFLLSKYTPLVGYNNSGKSNILAAIHWLLRRSLLSKNEFHNLSNSIVVIANISGITDELLNSMVQIHASSIRPYVVDGRMRIKRTQAQDASKAAEIKLDVWHPEESSWKANPSGIDNAISKLLPEPIRIGAMEDAAEDVAKAKTSTTIGRLLAELIEPIRSKHESDISCHLDEISRRICSDGDLRLSELVGVETEINVKVDELFPGIKARLHFPVPALEDLIKAGTLRLHEDNNEPREIAAFGHGTQRSVQMALIRHLAEVRQRDHSAPTTTLLLIDEPELYLHPFAVEQIRAALHSLSENGYQVILSTHSAQLIPAEYAQYALLVRKVQGKTVVRERLADAIQKLVPDSRHQMEQIFMLTNSSQVLFSEKVVLVEGKTELRLLPKIFHKLQGKTLGQDKCALVVQHGVSDTSKSLRILDEMAIPAKAIVDLDYAVKGAVQDKFLKESDSDIAAIKAVFVKLSKEGRIEIDGDNLPAKGKLGVKSSEAFRLMAKDPDAVSHIDSLHKKLKAEKIWFWKRGAIEDHLGINGKREADWAEFNSKMDKDGFDKTCVDAIFVSEMVEWIAT